MKWCVLWFLQFLVLLMHCAYVQYYYWMVIVQYIQVFVYKLIVGLIEIAAFLISESFSAEKWQLPFFSQCIVNILSLNEFRKLNICAMKIMCINVLMPVGSYFLHQYMFPLSGVTEALKIWCLNVHNSITAVLSVVECSCHSMLYNFQLGSKHKCVYEWFRFLLFLLLPDTSNWLIYRR